MIKNHEFQEKIKRVRSILNVLGAKGILINRQINFSWLTGGRGHIGLASENSCGFILITEKRICLLANNIEASRLKNEEMTDCDGVEVIEFPWYEEEKLEGLLAQISEGGTVVKDIDIPNHMATLREILCKEEIERYRWLGKNSALALESSCKTAVQGETEYEIAARLNEKLTRLGIDAITTLVAVDERMFTCRHPIPTGKSLNKYGMIAICARKWGLIVSATRLFHFGTPTVEIKHKHEQVLFVDAVMMQKTRPGAHISDIFAKTCDLYKEAGFPGEWKLHHQGGATGYMARNYRAMGNSTQQVKNLQAFAWNPTITGVKSEDTMIVFEHGNEIITHTGSFVYKKIEIEGQIILRPDILIL